MIVFKRRNWFRQVAPFSFCIAIFIVILAFTMPSVHAQQPNVATASFVVLSGTRPDQRGGSNDQRTGKPIQGCFVFVPPINSPKFNKYPEMRRWLDAHRGSRPAKRHRFKLEGGAILPAATIMRAGDSVDRYLSRDTPLSLTMFSNLPMGPGPSSIRVYTFKKTELIPIRISAVAQAATTSHALILDHAFGATSDENGRIVMSGLPVGIDIPMRVSVPTVKHKISFQSDTLDIKNNGWFVLRLDGDTECFHITVAANTQD